MPKAENASRWTARLSSPLRWVKMAKSSSRRHPRPVPQKDALLRALPYGLREGCPTELQIRRCRQGLLQPRSGRVPVLDPKRKVVLKVPHGAREHIVNIMSMQRPGEPPPLRSRKSVTALAFC